MPLKPVDSVLNPGIVVVAASAGGLSALFGVLAPLPANFPLPILIAQHLLPTSRSRLPEVLQLRTALAVKWAEEGEQPRPGTICVCPPGRHLMLTPRRLLSLRAIRKGTRFRPTADFLFETAAAAFGSRTIGLVLSGMLDDGARGAGAINLAGGITMAQCERSSEYFDMPAAAIDFGRTELIGSPREIARYLTVLGEMAVEQDEAA